MVDSGLDLGVDSVIDSAGLRVKALEVHRRLCQAYGCPFPFFSDKDPLTELVSALLSHRTKNRDSGRALKALQGSFDSWEAVANAPVDSVANAISAATWPEQKAPRIQAALQQILAERGEFSLDFLADMDAGAAQTWLERLNGVGPKTSAAVLSFSRLRMPALPVDSHHHRVAQRLGLIPKSMGPGSAHAVLRAQLPKDWDTQQLYDNHEILMVHGQKCCSYKNPACERCPLLDLCQYGQRQTTTNV